MIYRSLLLCIVASVALSLEAEGQGLRFFEFTFRHINTDSLNLIAATSDTGVIRLAEQQLALPEGERGKIIHGPIARGTGDNNSRYSWHFVVNAWGLADVAVEVCDGRPDKDVEPALDYWIDTVGSYCPWTSILKREIVPTNIEESIEDAGLALYYNEAGGELIIRTAAINGVILQAIHIVDIQGRTLLQQSLSDHEEHYSIDFSSIESGAYFALLFTNKRVLVQKVLKRE